MAETVSRVLSFSISWETRTLDSRKGRFLDFSATLSARKGSFLCLRSNFRSRTSTGVRSKAMAESCTAGGEKESLWEKYNSMKTKLFPEVPVVDVENLKSLIERKKLGEEKVVVVDVRTKDETAVSMIPGGTLKQNDFEKRIDDFRDHKVVCYCTIGYRSAKLVQDLVQQKIDARNLEGSILAWTHDQLPLTTQYNEERGSGEAGEGETKKIHVFSKDWRLQGEGYEPVWFEKKDIPLANVFWQQFRLSLPLWLRGKPKN